MNKDRILALADFVESNNLPFNMLRHTTCLMAHAAVLWGIEISSAETAKYLGLSGHVQRGEVSELLFPGGAPVKDQWAGMEDITREQTVATLRCFAETGKINYWP